MAAILESSLTKYPPLTTVSFCLVFIDTQRVLNQKVSFMFQFFPGSRILRASSMRLWSLFAQIHMQSLLKSKLGQVGVSSNIAQIHSSSL